MSTPLNYRHQGLVISAQGLSNSKRTGTTRITSGRDKRTMNGNGTSETRSYSNLPNGVNNTISTSNTSLSGALPMGLSNVNSLQQTEGVTSHLAVSSHSSSNPQLTSSMSTHNQMPTTASTDKYAFGRNSQSMQSVLGQTPVPPSVPSPSASNRPQSAVTAAQRRIYEYSARKFQRFDNSDIDQRAGEQSQSRPQTDPGKGRKDSEARPTLMTTESTYTDHSETSSTDSHSTNERSIRSSGKLGYVDNAQQNEGRTNHSNPQSNGSQMLMGSSTVPVRDDEVIIHVYDETNKINKDFVCKRDLLLKEMKYFSAYLTENCSFDDIDISVHCDVNIFQWLMDYIKNPGKPPKLDTSWAVSILISSHFLEMNKLVQTTLRFVHDRLQQIIKLPIDLDCINNKLMTKLAKLFTCDELDQIRDKRDKIISRLYQKKLEQFLTEEGHSLAFCQHCKKVYHSEFRAWMICPKAKMYVDVHGKMVAKHTIDPNWNINKFIIALKKAMLTWKQIYWQIWGLVHCFYCTRCNSLFPANELDWCAYHPKEATFEADTNVGRYACCKSKTMCFDSGAVLPRKGCTPRHHVVTTTKETSDAKSLDTLMRKTKQISTPHGSSLPTGENEETFELLSNEEPTYFEGLQDGQDESTDEKLQIKFHKCEIYFSYSRKYRVDGVPLNPPLKLERKKKKSDTSTKMSVTRTRFFLLDKQRENDEILMKNITNMLHKCRKHAKNQPDKKRKKRTKRNKSIGPGSTTKKIIRM